MSTDMLTAKEVSHKTRDEDYNDESDDDQQHIVLPHEGVEVPKEFVDISPHAIDVLSHFTIISDSSVKTPKYRCKCCKYEFTASSTTRLKQHIMGYEIYAADTPRKVVKDIKECSNPYPPLKENLIMEFNNNKLHKRPREERMSSSGAAAGEDGELAPKSGRKKARLSEAPKTPVHPISWTNEASISAREYSIVASKESFDDQWPEFEVQETASLAVPTTFSKNDSPIFEWIETVIGDWVSAANTVAYREGSSLRYSVYEVLKSFSFLSEHFRLFGHSSGSLDSMEINYAIDRFVGRNLNQSSSSSSSMATLGGNGADFTPLNVDTTNAQQVKDLCSAVNKYASAHGRGVDFSIVEQASNNKVKCIVEVNENLANALQQDGKAAGFWDMVQDLARTQTLNGLKSTLFGILTDCKTWVFFKVDGRSISHSTPYNLFNNELTAPEMSEQSYTVCKFLLDIFQISNQLNLKQKSEAVTVYKKNYAEAALISLKDNLRIAQEIKKKDDEIIRLREELAKLKSNNNKTAAK